jgi:hypothetical protein
LGSFWKVVVGQAKGEALDLPKGNSILGSVKVSALFLQKNSSHFQKKALVTGLIRG